MKKIRLPVLASLVLVALLAAVPAYADPNPGKGNTDVIVTNTTTSAANVTAIYYNTAGVAEYPSNRTIPGRGTENFKAADAQLGDNWSGSMIVQSDAELAAVAEIHWTGGTFADGKEADAYTGYAVGAPEMYFPSVVLASDRYTMLTVQNTENSQVTINLEYRNRNGGLDGTLSTTIPALGSKSFAMNAPGVGVPDLKQTAYYQQQGNWNGAVRISANGGLRIAAVASEPVTNYSSAYNGLTTGTQVNYLPQVERRFEGGAWVEHSGITIQCLSTTSCEVEVEFQPINPNPNNLKPLILPRKTVQPGAAVGANTNTGGSWGASGRDLFKNVLGDSWVGSAVVRSTNGTNLGVIVNTMRVRNALASAYSGFNTQNAGLEIILPAIYKVNSENVNCPTAGWQRYSMVSIQNPGTNNASNVDIFYFRPDGSKAFEQLNLTIEAGKIISRNMSNQCSSILVGGNFVGSMVISSDQPLVAMSKNLWPFTEMAAYNGYSR